ncbi:MAG: DUF4175 family protein [Sandaracinus sp.]|nr:DUF4175 family protein [Sandaracinus sp.]
MVEAERNLRRALGRLRRRGWLVHALRGLVLCVGVTALAFALGAFAVGPVVPTAAAVAAWSVIGLAFAGALAYAGRPAVALRGAGAARLLEARDPALASMARSAIELSVQPSGAPELVAAHLREVERRVTLVRPREVTPWSLLGRPHVALFFLVAIAAIAGTFANDRAAAGAFALLHPGARADGVHLADVVTDVRAELTFPSYLGREPSAVEGQTQLAAPIGTAVRWTARARLGLSRASLDVAGTRVPMEREGDRWVARFFVREDGPLRVDVRDDEGRPLRDALSRSLHAIPDAAPEVRWLEPGLEETVALDEPVVHDFTVEDDHAIAELALVVETAAGTTERRPIPHPGIATHSGAVRVSAVELDARPGDTLAYWLEATDRDDVTGPNVGRSERRTLRVASDATERAEALADLEGARDAGLDALADRLELEHSGEEERERARHRATYASSNAFAERLEALGRAPTQGFDARVVDASVLATMGRRLARSLAEETRLYGPRLAAEATRHQRDDTLVTLLEEQTLFLDDLLARARLDDAASIARELDALRREMTSLLAELRRTSSPEARAQLLAALRRARARAAELAERIAAMGNDVPSEFLNADALPEQETQDALRAMQEAIERDDLDAAEQALADLQRQIDAMAGALSGAEGELADARFGPRERAMAEAMDTLAGLETEQRGLADRSESLRREAADRALEAAGAAAEEAARGLADRAARTREALDGIPEDALGPYDREMVDRARQRVRDVEDALRSGDLGEARRMAAEAHADASGLARDLELSALMFAGRDGQVATAARQAGRAAQSARELSERVEDVLPRLGEHLAEEERERLRGDAPRQGQAEEAAERLSEAFRAEPDGQPLSPESAESVDRAREAMERAARALERGEPVDATRAQQDAARRLTELREELERQSNPPPDGGGGGGGGEGRPQQGRRVEIASDGQGSELAERRRRVLDGMRRPAPRGYEEAVRRYYEELLR